MKKMRKIRGSILFLTLIIFFGVSFVQASIIQTKNSLGVVTANFSTSDEVFLKSTSGLCNNAYSEVNVYILNSVNTALTDVRGEPQEINLTKDYQIPSNTKIWANPSAGNYDVIIDCDQNGEYSPLEPKTSFSVNFKKGSGNASIGIEIPNHSWQYDPEQSDLLNEMLQIKLLAEGEDINLSKITIKASGTGTGDDTQLDALEVYIDGNNNGKLDENEVAIGDSQPAYLQDNGTTVIGLDHTLTSGIAENILIVYKMKENVTEGNFSFSVIGLSGLGAQSGEEIKFSGFPINSSVKKVLAKKTCLGSLALVFEPNPVNRGENTVAKVSNLTGCDNKTVFLRVTSCNYQSGNIGNCVLKNDTCQLNLSSPENIIYYACIDKNNNNEETDFGEFTFSNMIVNANNLINQTNQTNQTSVELITVTNNTNSGNPSVTGNVVGGLFDGSLKGVFILLEITLILILVVLVIISFKLKGNKREKEESESEE
jgi:hypothetical protein